MARSPGNPDTGGGQRLPFNASTAPWFDLAIYRDVPRWSLYDWYRAIACRLAVGGQRFSQSPSCHWVAIASDPIKGNGLRNTASGPLDWVSTDHDAPVQPVLQPGVELDEDVVQAINSATHEVDFGLVAIDLGASDSDLKSAFAHWLRSRRRHGKAARRGITQDDAENWAKSRVIPYIDITLYEEAQNIRFRRVDIENALFADLVLEGRGREPKKILEQSTVKYAERLRSLSHFRRLAAQFDDPDKPVKR